MKKAILALTVVAMMLAGCASNGSSAATDVSGNVTVSENVTVNAAAK